MAKPKLYTRISKYAVPKKDLEITDESVGFSFSGLTTHEDHPFVALPKIGAKGELYWSVTHINIGAALCTIVKQKDVIAFLKTLEENLMEYIDTTDSFAKKVFPDVLYSMDNKEIFLHMQKNQKLLDWVVECNSQKRFIPYA